LGTVQDEVILIHDTHRKAVTEHRWQKEWTKGQGLFHCSIKKHAESGVAILVRSKNMHMERLYSDLQDRILTAEDFKEH